MRKLSEKPSSKTVKIGETAKKVEVAGLELAGVSLAVPGS